MKNRRGSSRPPTAFAPFPETTDYFGDSGKAWMVNFRVASLDAMMAQLRAAGIAVELDAQIYPMPLRPSDDLKATPSELGTAGRNAHKRARSLQGSAGWTARATLSRPGACKSRPSRDSRASREASSSS